MFGSFGETDRTLAVFDELRRRMDRVWDGIEASGDGSDAGVWPRANLFDAGAELVLVAEVPGVAEADLQLTVTHDGLTVSGARKALVPEGHSVHRKERSALEFRRSFALPARVDTEKASASVKHGILTVTLPKAADARPRQISVRAS